MRGHLGGDQITGSGGGGVGGWRSRPAPFTCTDMNPGRQFRFSAGMILLRQSQPYCVPGFLPWSCCCGAKQVSQDERGYCLGPEQRGRRGADSAYIFKERNRICCGIGCGVTERKREDLGQGQDLSDWLNKGVFS